MRIALKLEELSIFENYEFFKKLVVFEGWAQTFDIELGAQALISLLFQR
jgi:hypothetical protein